MHHATSKHEELQAVVGRALVDPTFRKGLLNGHRAECLEEYRLTSEQRRFASEIDASDLTSFARQLDSWISGSKTRVTTPARLSVPSAVRPLSAVA